MAGQLVVRQRTAPKCPRLLLPLLLLWTSLPPPTSASRRRLEAGREPLLRDRSGWPGTKAFALQRELTNKVLPELVATLRRDVSPPVQLLAIVEFKEECLVWNEWLHHHASRAVGVGHFLMLNNGNFSQPCPGFEAMTPSTAAAVDAPRLTVIPFPYPHAQREAYRLAMQAVARAEVADWAAIIDMDEFVFSSAGARAPLRQVVEQLGGVNGTAVAKVDQICVPWINFGSSGLVAQPRCVVKSFTRREELDGPRHTKW